MAENFVSVIAVTTAEKHQTIKRALEQQGVCLVPAMFTPDEIDRYCAEAERLWQNQQERVAQNLRLGLRVDRQGNTVLDRIDPVEDISEVFFQLNRHEKILTVVESVFAEPARVMKEKLIFKLPGTSGFSVHRDDPYFRISGVPGDKVLSIAIALDAAKKDNGNIEFFPELVKKPLPADTDEPRDIDPNSVAGSPVFSPRLERGDAVIYNALVPHQSGSNTSKHSRRTYTISYVPLSYPQARETYYQVRYQQQQQEREARITGPFFVI